MIKKWLVFTRAHTLPLETVPAIVGAWAAGASWLGVVLWGIVGACYHLGGYAMNSVTDYYNGYDKDDPHKQHHPLNTGEISIRTGVKVTSATIAIGVGLASHSIITNRAWIAAGLLVIGFICGVVYNQYGKRTEWKFIFISAAHSSMFAVPYLVYGEIDAVFRGGTLLVFLWVMFQISVSGEVKDITTDEENFIKSLGLKPVKVGLGPVEEYYLDNMRGEAIFYSTTIRVAIAITALATLLSVSGGDVNALPAGLILIIGTAALLRTYDMLQSGAYNRQKRIGHMSQVEALTLAMFVLAFNPSLGVTASLALIGGSTAWVFILSKIMWSSRLAPEV